MDYGNEGLANLTASEMGIIQMNVLALDHCILNDAGKKIETEKLRSNDKLSKRKTELKII
jgi:hypothetical protein